MLKSVQNFLLFFFLIPLACAPVEKSKMLEKRFASVRPDLAEIKYSKYYKFVGTDKISGVYIVWEEEFHQSVKQACLAEKIEVYPCNDKNFGYVAPGHEAWLEEDATFPFAADLGCDYVEFLYNVKNDAFDYIRCD